MKVIEMKESMKERLLKCGPEAMADALLELSSRNDIAGEMVDRMTATPKDILRRLKSRLSGLKRGTDFVPYRYSGELAFKLDAILADIGAAVEDPREGVELLLKFYEADKVTLGRCDDSGGRISSVFTYGAKDIFVSYAIRCEDKSWLAGKLFDLNMEDGYCVRGALIDCAGEFLPEPEMRDLIRRFREKADIERDEYSKSHWLYKVKSLARQLKDAELFERTTFEIYGDDSVVAGIIDSAGVYLAAGDAESALSRLEKLSISDDYMSYERDKFLLDAYTMLGQNQKREETAWRIFRKHRTPDTLDSLLGVLGEQRRGDVIESETREILKDKFLRISNIEFLLSLGKIDEAESCLLERARELNGDHYSSLLPIAKSFEEAGRKLACSLIYRALIDSTMARANSKYYPYAVRYLRKLESLGADISDWKGFPSHSQYRQNFDTRHAKKTSFWQKYGQQAN